MSSLGTGSARALSLLQKMHQVFLNNSTLLLLQLEEFHKRIFSVMIE